MKKKIKKVILKLLVINMVKKMIHLYGKKGAERRHIIDEYRKQYKQAELMKNKNNTQIRRWNA